MLLVLSLARIAPADHFAVGMAVYSVCTIIAAVSDAGTSTVALRTYKERGEVAAVSVLKFGSRIATAAGAVAMGVFLFLAIFNPILFQCVPLIAWAVIERNTETRSLIMLARHDDRAVSALILLRRLVAIPVFFSLITFVGPLLAYSLALLLPSGAAWAVSLRRTRMRAEVQAKEGAKRAHLREAVPFAVTAGVTQLRHLDVTLVLMFAGPDPAAVYSLAIRLANPLLIVYTSISSQLLARHNVEHSQKYPYLGLAIISTNLIASAILTLFAKPLVALLANIIPWLDASYASLLTTVMASYLFIGAGIIFGSILTTFHRERTHAVVSACTVSVALVALVMGASFDKSLQAGAIGFFTVYVLMTLVLEYLVFVYSKRGAY